MASNWKLKKNTVHKEWKHLPTGIILRFTIEGKYAPYSKINYSTYEVELITKKEITTLYSKTIGRIDKKLQYLMKLRKRVMNRINKFLIRTNNYGMARLKKEKNKKWKRL